MNPFSGAQPSIIDSLRGSIIQVPELLPLFDKYPFGVNPHLHVLRPIVNKRIESFYPDDPAKASKMKSYDFALFTATWWPHIEFERLVVVAYFCLWIFLWDDEFDSRTGNLHSDLEGASQSRLEALAYVNQCLGLWHSYGQLVPTNRVTRGFKDIADALCQEYSADEREHFFQVFRVYVECMAEELRQQLHDICPSVDDYLVLRKGNSAASLTIAMNSYSVNQKLPEALRGHPAVQELCNQTNLAVSMYRTNDILSLKKEFKQCAVHTIIPITYRETGDAQGSADFAVELVKNALRRFEEARIDLIDAAIANSIPQDQVEWYIRGCEYHMTGNIQWSLVTGRYDIQSDYDPEARSVSFVLNDSS